MTMLEAAEIQLAKPKTRFSPQQRNLAGACLAHLLHDGYTDQLYALLPIWQAQFGLSYAGLAVIRALYSGTMGGLQVSGNRLTSGFGARAVLVLATLIAAFGFAVTVLPGGLPSLCIGLVIAGIGSSLQHPRASLLVASSFGNSSRGPLGIYNFAGDLGKSIFPAAVALLLTVTAWRPILALTALAGLAVTVALVWVLPKQPFSAPAPKKQLAHAGSGKGFGLLIAIGALDTATRMGYLLFLPFLLHAKGGKQAALGIGLALLFSGGALGKAACGWLGQRLGVVGTVITTEAATGILILATLFLPLQPMLILLPVLGLVLNGTSSVLYGTVPELAPKNDTGKGFAVFYTGVIGAGGLAPIAYGMIADHWSRGTGVTASAITALAIVPLILLLRPALSHHQQG